MCSQKVYSDVLINHYKNPVKKGRLSSETFLETGYNPKCGDVIHLSMRIGNDDVIEDIMFDGKGCMLCLASASILTQQIAKTTVKKAQGLIGEVENLVKTQALDPGEPALPDDIIALGSIRQYPTRVQCITLAWQTLDKALHRTKG